MISVKQAKKILSEICWQLDSEILNVVEASGRVISKNIFTSIDVPSFDNSAMDGYAILYEKDKTSYDVYDTIQAGDTNMHELKKGAAARIYTGAPIPKGANAVIQQELVTLNNNEINFEPGCIEQGANVRNQGSQCKVGDMIVKENTKITPGIISLLISVGIVEISVYKNPKIKIIVTGNELVEPGNCINRGQIYNSNEPAIIAYLKMLGIHMVNSIRVKDDKDQLQKEISEALNKVDILILSGGISVGDYDFVYETLQKEDVDILFYKIKQKPGKPILAAKKNETLIFALPGNPAAVLTCLNQYVKPCVKYMRGFKEIFNRKTLLPLAHFWEKKGAMANILKAVVKNGKVYILHGQDSFNLLPFKEANSFVLLHENEMIKNKGELVEVYNW